MDYCPVLLTFRFFARREDFQRQAAKSQRRKESQGLGILLLKRPPRVDGWLRRSVTLSDFAPWRLCVMSVCVSFRLDLGCGAPAL
jgi:hypothetical protein